MREDAFAREISHTRTPRTARPVEAGDCIRLARRICGGRKHWVLEKARKLSATDGRTGLACSVVFGDGGSGGRFKRMINEWVRK